MKKLLTALFATALVPAGAYVFVSALAPAGANAQSVSAQTPDIAAGKVLWEGNGTQCRNCHGTTGEGGFGPDLAGRGLSAAQYVQAVRHPWGIMPMFVDSQVSDAELANIAAYFGSLPKSAAPAAWKVPVDPSMPHGQQVLVSMGCAQCHGATFNNARTTLGGNGGDFALFESVVYDYVNNSPKIDADLAAARTAALPPPAPAAAPAPPGAAPTAGRGNFGPRRLVMGNFVPSRVSEAQLRDIYNWAKDEIGLRPSLQARFTAPTAGTPTYNLLLANTGIANKGEAAQGLVVDLSIPAGVTVVSAAGSSYKGIHKDATGVDVAEWQISSLAPKNNLNLTITLSAVPADTSGLKGTIHWAKPRPKSGPSVDSMNFALAGAGRGGAGGGAPAAAPGAGGRGG